MSVCLRIGFLTVLLASCAPTLAGVVQDGDGKPIQTQAGTVNVSSLTSNDSFVLSVGPDGKFATEVDIPPGEYLVEALVPGYELQSKKYTVGEEGDLVLQLQPLAKGRPSAIGANLDGEVSRGAGGATLTPPKL